MPQCDVSPPALVQCSPSLQAEQPASWMWPPEPVTLHAIFAIAFPHHAQRPHSQHNQTPAPEDCSVAGIGNTEWIESNPSPAGATLCSPGSRKS